MTISKVLLFKSGKLLCQIPQSVNRTSYFFSPAPLVPLTHTHTPNMHTHNHTPILHPPPLSQNTHTHILTLSLSHAHTRTHARMHASAHTHTHTRTHSFFLVFNCFQQDVRDAFFFNFEDCITNKCVYQFWLTFRTISRTCSELDGAEMVPQIPPQLKVVIHLGCSLPTQQYIYSPIYISGIVGEKCQYFT